jgi:hypothetical protein
MNISLDFVTEQRLGGEARWSEGICMRRIKQDEDSGCRGETQGEIVGGIPWLHSKHGEGGTALGMN